MIAKRKEKLKEEENRGKKNERRERKMRRTRPWPTLA
jgi:hypothetical protein